MAVSFLSVAEAARAYLRQGWRVIPVPIGKKRPRIRGWQLIQLTEDDVETVFGHGPSNLGVLLGKPSGGLVDVDLDAPETGALAGEFLPPTEAVFGRASKPRSHWLYVCPEANRTVTFKDPDGHVLLEIRTTGAQTIFPPSVHPSGEAVAWDLKSTLSPAATAFEGLERATGRLAAAALLARHWPERGSRHEAALALAGGLLRAGWSPDEVARFIIITSKAAGDEEWSTDRARSATDTAGTLDGGGPATGFPTLANLIGQEVVDCVTEALGLDLRALLPALHLTDLGNAERLVERHGRDLRYCHQLNSWFAWDGARLAPDQTGEVARRAAETVRSLTDLAATLPNRRARERVAVWAQQSESGYHLEQMVRLARSQPAVVVQSDELDKNPRLFNVLNGTLDVWNRELRPHDPGDLITKLAPVEYDPGARGDRWWGHLERCLPDPEVQRQVQRDLGLALMGAGLQEILPVWHGTGGNGKTTTLRVIRQIFGDYGAMAPPRLLLAAPFERHPTELADLFGRRLVFSAEIGEQSRLDEERVKVLTGGENVKARLIRGNFFEFPRTWTLVLVCNHRPEIRSTDDGIWRRVRLVPWTRQIPEGERRPQNEVVEELVAEGSAILNWLLNGLEDWKRDPGWVATAVRAVSDDYRAEMDAIGEFLQDRCEVGPSHKTLKSELYEAYTAWCVMNGESPLNRKGFTMRLQDRGIHEYRSDGKRYHQGIRLNHSVAPLSDQWGLPSLDGE